jgi:hypothetical protein
MKDILPPRALPQRQISGNALASYFSDEFQSIRAASRQLEFRMLAHVRDNARRQIFVKIKEMFLEIFQ